MPSTISGGGILPYGYLGVDIFFVVGGFLLIKSLKKRIDDGTFHYFQFIKEKLIRLWSLIILAALTAMVAGYFVMLPDDYENLAESVVASSVFAENVLQCITVKNYWNIANMYKPLMHLWYIGVLMQAYVVLPLVYLLVRKISRRYYVVIGTVGLTVLSLVAYTLPVFSSAWKFYLLPFRTFEITAGGLLLVWNPQTKQRKVYRWLSILALFIILGARTELLSGGVMLICTVLSTIVFLWSSSDTEFSKKEEKILAIGSKIGKRSYSVYIWHQLIAAFLFYTIFPRQNALALFVFITVTIALSLISFHFVEIPLGNLIRDRKRSIVGLIAIAIIAILLCGISFQIYRHAGVVRDVPELGISKDNVHRNMHAEYCDRPYSWDIDFTSDGRTKILVLGNSYGRDWANILYEYDSENALDISYIYYTEENLNDRIDRVNDADMVFFAIGPEEEKTVPLQLFKMVPRDKLWVVGNKQYGTSNGIVYAHRSSSRYFDQTTEVPSWIIEMNQDNKNEYGDHFIDLLMPIMRGGNKVSVFTDDNKFISQDCFHLTEAGARYYARILDLQNAMNKKE